jgi:hypothetical protein
MHQQVMANFNLLKLSFTVHDETTHFSAAPWSLVLVQMHVVSVSWQDDSATAVTKHNCYKG